MFTSSHNQIGWLLKSFYLVVLLISIAVLLVYVPHFSKYLSHSAWLFWPTTLLAVALSTSGIVWSLHELAAGTSWKWVRLPLAVLRHRHFDAGVTLFLSVGLLLEWYIEPKPTLLIMGIIGMVVAAILFYRRFSPRKEPG